MPAIFGQLFMHKNASSLCLVPVSLKVEFKMAAAMINTIFACFLSC